MEDEMEKDGLEAPDPFLDLPERAQFTATRVELFARTETDTAIRHALHEFKRELRRLEITDHARVRALLGTIHENLFDPRLTVAWLRARCRIRDHNSSSEFLHVVGLPVKAYITFRRLEMAARLLPYQEITVGVVAQRVGFLHAQTFHSAFRDHFGVSPRTFVSPPRQKPRPLRDCR